jgi:hypothetical protein
MTPPIYGARVPLPDIVGLAKRIILEPSSGTAVLTSDKHGTFINNNFILPKSFYKPNYFYKEFFISFIRI